MAQVIFPGGLRDRVVGLRPEIWSPNRIDRRKTDGRWHTREITTARYRGTIRFGPFSTIRPASRALLEDLEDWLAQMQEPEAWSWMPFGGDPPYYAIPAGWRATLQGVDQATGVYTFRRTASAVVLAAGQYISVSSGGRVSLVRLRTVSGTAALPTVTTSPDPGFAVGAVAAAATDMRIVQAEPRDAQITIERVRGLTEPVTFPWEELGIE